MKSDKRSKMTLFLLFPHLLMSCFPMSSANEADAKVMLENIAKGTTDPRVEFISQDHSSQILNILQFQNLD